MTLKVGEGRVDAMLSRAWLDEHALSRAELADLCAPSDWSRLRASVRGGAALPLVRCYADAAVGSAAALIGSSELLEVAVTNGHAAQQLRADVGAELLVYRE